MRRLAGVGALATLLTTAAAAQVERETLRVQEELQRRRLAAETEFLRRPRRDYSAFNSGGWLSTSYYSFKDDDNRRDRLDTLHGLLLTDLRVWFKLVTPRTWGTYVRMRKIHHRWFLGLRGISPNTSNIDSYDLDVGYVDAPAGQFRIRLGRQLLQAGRGLTLSDNLDALSFRWRHGPWASIAYFGRTPPLEDNIDSSVGLAGTGDAHRNFGHLELSHRNTKGQRIYGYALLEDDKTTNKNVANLNFNHEYMAQYFALGFEGPIARRIQTYGEMIRQTGRTFSQNVVLAPGRSSRDEVDAFAFISAIQYFVDDRRRQNVAFEYSIGSGDKDRGSVINTFGAGNAPNTRDTAFRYFGFYDLGLALSPRLTNLKVARLGYSIKPFLDRRGYAKDLQVGLRLATYSKEDALGVISPTTTTQANRADDRVGNALDAFLAWRIYTDLSLVAQWGRFNPGRAYTPGVDDPIDRLFTNVTASF